MQLMNGRIKETFSEADLFLLLLCSWLPFFPVLLLLSLFIYLFVVAFLSQHKHRIQIRCSQQHHHHNTSTPSHMQGPFRLATLPPDIILLVGYHPMETPQSLRPCIVVIVPSQLSGHISLVAGSESH